MSGVVVPAFSLKKRRSKFGYRLPAGMAHDSKTVVSVGVRTARTPTN
jgi:hypothetical protein